MSDGAMNLSVPRGGKSVWDKPGFSASLSAYDKERWMAAGCGSLLTLVGARVGGFGGGLLAAIGMTVAVRAAMGRHDLRTARDFLDRAMTDYGYGRHKDVVEDASEESFPASDSPSWTASAGATTDD